jgi:hypothetical protein
MYILDNIKITVLNLPRLLVLVNLFIQNFALECELILIHQQFSTVTRLHWSFTALTSSFLFFIFFGIKVHGWDLLFLSYSLLLVSFVFPFNGKHLLFLFKCDWSKPIIFLGLGNLISQLIIVKTCTTKLILLFKTIYSLVLMAIWRI